MTAAVQQKKQRDSRTRLLEAAASLFHEKGYAATGIAAILKEADVNSGSLYYHFENKDALLEGVLEWYLEYFHKVLITPIEEKHSDPLDRIFALLNHYRASLEATSFDYGCPIGKIAMEVNSSSPGRLKDLVAGNFGQWSGQVALWLEDWAADRGLDINAPQLASFILFLMEGAVMQARNARSLAAFDAMVSELKRHFELLENAGGHKEQ